MTDAVKETRPIVAVCVCLCNCKCLTVCVSLERSNSERSDGRWLKINGVHVCVPGLAVTHPPRDWTDWSISTLICARQPHLARSQGHTLYVHRTSQNPQDWDSWQREMMPNVPSVPVLPVLLTHHTHRDIILEDKKKTAMCPVLFRSFLVLSYPSLSCPVMSCPVLFSVSCYVQSCPMSPFCLILSYPAVLCSVLTDNIRSCLVLPCSVLSCPVITAPALVLIYNITYCPSPSYPTCVFLNMSFPIQLSPVLSCPVLS